MVYRFISACQSDEQSQISAYLSGILISIGHDGLIASIQFVSICSQLLFVFWVVYTNLVATPEENTKETVIDFIDKSGMQLKHKYASEYSLIMSSFKRPLSIHWLCVPFRLLALKMTIIYFCLLLVLFVLSYFIIEKVLEHTLLTISVIFIGMFTRFPIVLTLFIITLILMLLLGLNYLLCKAAPSYERAIYSYLNHSSVRVMVGNSPTRQVSLRAAKNAANVAITVYGAYIGMSVGEDVVRDEEAHRQATKTVDKQKELGQTPDSFPEVVKQHRHPSTSREILDKAHDILKGRRGGNPPEKPN
jgi:hypothetical protein